MLILYVETHLPLYAAVSEKAPQNACWQLLAECEMCSLKAFEALEILLRI